MDIPAQNEVLLQVADGGPMDYDLWPQLFPSVIERIEKISRTEFRIPTLPPPRPTPPQKLSGSTTILSSQPDPGKENAQPSSSATISADDPAAPSSSANAAKAKFATPPTSKPEVATAAGAEEIAVETEPAAAPETATGPGIGTTPSSPLSPKSQRDTSSAEVLPPQIISMLKGITDTLKKLFDQYPPHTMQRLAELVLYPNKHYRNLIPYLHALDRVVHVTSGANTYPLPPAIPDMSALQFLNISAEETSIADQAPPPQHPNISWANPTSTVPSDESQLGGAMLTPIPWLARQAEEAGAAATTPSGEFKTESTETIDGPNGMGSIETVSINLNGIPPPVMPPQGQGIGSGTATSAKAASKAPVSPSDMHLDGIEEPAGDNKQNDAAASGSSKMDQDDEEDEEIPHARGPAEIGAKDMGPQRPGAVLMDLAGIDLEAAVGRKAVVHHSLPPSSSPQLPPTTTAAAGESGGVTASATTSGASSDSSVTIAGDQRRSDDGNDDDDGDDDIESKALSPKREAEDELDGLARKRARSEDVATVDGVPEEGGENSSDVFGEKATAEGKGKGKEVVGDKKDDSGDKMDVDEARKGEGGSK